MKIPIHQFTPKKSPQSTVLANPNRNNARYAALSRIGDSIKGAGEQIANYELKKLEAVNAGVVASAGQSMQEGYLKFQSDLHDPETGSSDEQTWGKDWAKERGLIEKDLEIDSMAPAARARVEVMLEDWRGDTNQRVNAAIDKKEIERAIVEVVESAEFDLQNGNIEGHNLTIRDAEQRDLLSPKEASNRIRDAVKKAAEYEVNGMILRDPIAAHEQLLEETEGGNWKNFKGLDDTGRKMLERSANVAENQLRAAKMDELTGRVAEGEIIGDKELETLVDGKLMTQGEASRFRMNQIPDTLTAADAAVYADLITEIHAYDPQNDSTNSDHSRLRTLVATAPKAYQAQLTSLLNEAVDVDSPLNTKVAQDGFRLISDNYRLGVYGKFETRVDMGLGKFKTVIDKKILKEAQDKRAMLEDAFSDFVRENPFASRSAQAEFLSGENEEAVVESGTALLGGDLFDFSSNEDDFSPTP